MEPQALQGPGEVRGQRSQKLSGWVPGPGAWEVKTVQMEVQGQPGGLGGGQAEAAEEGFIQDLSLGLGALDWQKKALAQDTAHAGRVCVIPKHRAELQGHVCLQLAGKHCQWLQLDQGTARARGNHTEVAKGLLDTFHDVLSGWGVHWNNEMDPINVFQFQSCLDLPFRSNWDPISDSTVGGCGSPGSL